MTDYITYTPNDHINTLPDFKHLVKCDRVVDDKPSEIEVSIDPTTGNVAVGDPVRGYEHLGGVQLLLEYTKNEE